MTTKFWIMTIWVNFMVLVLFAVASESHPYDHWTHKVAKYSARVLIAIIAVCVTAFIWSVQI